MLRTCRCVSALVALMLALGCSSTNEVRTGAMTPHDDGDGDVQVTLAQCPEAVQATILQHAGNGAIIEIERTTDHGEVLFEVDVQGESGVFEFDVAEDGTFRGMEDDDDDDDDGDDSDD